MLVDISYDIRIKTLLTFFNIQLRSPMIRYFFLCLFTCLFIYSTGCQKRTPVSELSVEQSGIEITEEEDWITASDWPAWRGTKCNGIAQDQAVPTHWSESEGICWRVGVPGRGHSSPIIVGNQIVVASAIEKDQQQLIVSFDRVTGREQWRTMIHEGGFPSRRDVHVKATNANSTVASDGRKLFIAMLNSEKIHVTALDLKGNQIWQKEAGAFASKFGYAPSPVLYKSLVIIAADNFGGGYLAAFDKQTGELAWRTARGDASSYSSPSLATVGGRDQLLITGGDRMASYDPATGKLNWKTPCIAEATCGTVLVASDRLFASGGYPDKETLCLSSTGERIWSNRTKVYEPSLVAYEGNVFAINDDGIAYCWTIEDGDLLWRERLGGNFSSSPVICNGNIYVANLSGECFVFRATGESYQQVAKNYLGSDCYASPAFSDGQVVFRVGVGNGNDRREELVCIGEPNEDTDAVAIAN